MMLRIVGSASLLLPLALTIQSTAAHHPASIGAHQVLAASVTTTHTALTTNNTAACSAAGYGLSGTGYCGSAFAGWTDLSSPSGSATQPLTQPHDPAVSGTWNISKGRGTQSGDVHSLLYSGATTKILAETQMWFCHGSGGSNVTVDGQTLTRYENCPNIGFSAGVGHFDVGYSSSDQAKADATADDLWDRGFDGTVMDWSGDPNTCKSGSGSYSNNAPFASACNSANVSTVDLASRRLASSMDTRHPGMTHFVMYDDSAYKFTQCNTQDIWQPQCVQNKMFADFNVLAANWFGDSGYLKINGQPVVAFFVNQSSGNATFSQCSTTNVCHLTGSFTCTSASGCWNALLDGLRTNFQNHGYNPYMIFEGNESHYQGDGAFSWVHPLGGTQGTAADQDNWGTKSTLDSELSTGASTLASGTTGANGLPKTYFAGAWKGFDDRMASWSPSWSNGSPVPAPVPSGNYPRITSQRCGTNWLDTFGEAGQYFSTANQLPFMMVGTWDDYEEGTAVEMGISNCVTSFTSSVVNGSTLQWTIGLSGDGASERTVDHYTVWYSTDGTTGEQLAQLTTVAATGSGTSASYSLDLSQYCATLPATSVLYVQAVGKPSITNHLTSGLTYQNQCTSTTLSGKVTNLNTGGAISGATVSITGPATASTTTDANGNYSFTGLQPGTYSVTGTHSGYKARTYSNVTVTAGQTTTQDIQLTTTGRVTGTVTSSQSGAPVVGATITLQGGNLPTTDTVTTNSSGSYTSNWDPIGTYTVTCSAPGFSTDTISNVQITTGGLTTVNCQI